MDVLLKGRGIKVTDRMRELAGERLRRLERHDPRVSRVELEVIAEPTPRIEGGFRVEAACETRRRVVRAHGSGPDVDAAFEQVAARLDRQLARYRGKLRSYLSRRGDRLQSTPD